MSIASRPVAGREPPSKSISTGAKKIAGREPPSKTQAARTAPAKVGAKGREPPSKGGSR